jgi:hypothetical protein
MAYGFDPGALLARSYALPRGPRVCLRLARIRDLRAIEELAAGRGVELDALGLARLVRGDPRQRVVICATALVRGSETVVAVGAIDVSATEPSLLVVDELVTDGLSGLLTAALTGRAASLRRARAGQPASTLTA